MPQEQGCRIAEQPGEYRANGLCGLARKLATGGRSNVGHGPAANHRIERQNQETGQHADSTDHPPDRFQALACCNQAQAVDGAVATPAANHDFSHHDGNTDHGNADQVYQDKGATAVLTGNVGEFPDIAEADGGTGGGEDKGEAR